MKSRSIRPRAVVAAVAAGLVVIAVAAIGHPPIGSAHAIPPLAATPAAVARTVASVPDFAAIVERHGPAVVNISVVGTVRTAVPGADENGPFGELLRRFGAIPREPQPSQGFGSGFIVKSDGTILTNAHVVANAREVTVKLTDKREFKARVLGIDKATDVAVLKVDAQDLPVVRIGNPAATRVGDWVLAIGAPFGFENTVTSGIVSGKSRALPEEGYVPFLQTDVAINPGNSGGPLFNLDGEVIGINSQIYSRTGGYQGLSFAIPIDIAMRIEQQLVAHGVVTRGRLGVTIQELTQPLAESFGLASPQGALVSSVEAGGPAARAGLRAGDVIVGIDGTNVANSNELPPIVADRAPGSSVRLDVWRQGKRIVIDATVGSSGGSVARSDTPAPEPGRLGLAVRPLTPDEQRAAGVGAGVVVEAASGPARRAGLRPGDLVLAVNGTNVGSPDDLRAATAGAGKRLALLVQRNKETIYVPLEVG